jgi:dinuclear metal center YbgI/SA1388 family protein
MTLSDFLHRIQQILPPATAMPGDPIGIQVASSSGIVSKVLTCMEITDAVVDEALNLGCDTVVTFHPLIYAPLTAIAGQDRVARLVARLVRSDISVISVHTSFDAFPQGTNAILAQKLGLTIEHPLQAVTNTPDAVHSEAFGIGLVTSCSMEFHELIERIATVTGAPVRFSRPATNSVSRVAIVAGSGMSFYRLAVQCRADVFITADVKYHDFHAATDTIGLIDPGHYEMEQFVPDGLRESFHSLRDACTIVSSSIRTSPVEYYTPTNN